MRARYFISKYTLPEFPNLDFQVYNKVNKYEDASLVQYNKVAHYVKFVEDCS